jgi:hypothetical protein
MEELVQPAGTETHIRRKTGNLQSMAKEIERKINSVELMISGGAQTKRILSLGGRVMKYLFRTALAADITLLNYRTDKMDNTQGSLIHDVRKQISLSGVWEDNVEVNSRKTYLLLKQLRTLETERWRQNASRLVNDSQAEIEQGRRISSCLRKIDVLLLRVYSDVIEVALGLELAALTRLAAILMPVDRLMEVVRQITVHVPPEFSCLRPVKAGFMYVFYSTMQVHAVT